MYRDGSRADQVLRTDSKKDETHRVVGVAVTAAGEIKAGDLVFSVGVDPKRVEAVQQAASEYRALSELGVPFDIDALLRRADELELEVDKYQGQIEELEQRLQSMERNCNKSTSRGRETVGTNYKAEFRSQSGKERKVYVYVGANDEGRPVEVFITDKRGGGDTHAYASAFAVTLSLALKHGVPADDLIHSLRGIQGDSISYTGGVFQSVPDLVAKRLEQALKQAKAADDGYIELTKPVMYDVTFAPNVIDSGVIRATPVTSDTAGPNTIRTVANFDECASCGELGVDISNGGCPPCVLCGFSKCG